MPAVRRMSAPRMSPWVMIPHSSPVSSTTGRRRTSCSRISASASLTGAFRLTVITGERIQ
jgi:hypothetical protein